MTWYVDDQILDSKWLDVLGLVLQIPSSFIESLLYRMEYVRGIEEPTEVRRLRLQHLTVGDCVANLLIRNESVIGSTTPIVLICYVCGHSDGLYKPRHQLFRVQKLLGIEVLEDAPFSRPNRTSLKVEPDQRSNDDYPIGVLGGLSNHYQRLLRQMLKQERNIDSQADLLFHVSLLPFLKIDALRLQAIY